MAKLHPVLFHPSGPIDRERLKGIRKERLQSVWIRERRRIRVIRVIRSEALKEEFSNYVAAYGLMTEGEKIGVVPTPIKQPEEDSEENYRYEGGLIVRAETEKDTARRMKTHPPPERPEGRAKLG